MARGQPNHRLIKIHRSYTIGKIADLLRRRGNTVREWIMSVGNLQRRSKGFGE